MTQAKRPLAVAATSVVIALAGAGSAWACDGTGGSAGTYPGTYPGDTTSSSTTTTSSFYDGDRGPQGRAGTPGAQRSAVLGERGASSSGRPST